MHDFREGETNTLTPRDVLDHTSLGYEYDNYSLDSTIFELIFKEQYICITKYKQLEYCYKKSKIFEVFTLSIQNMIIVNM